MLRHLHGALTWEPRPRPKWSRRARQPRAIVRAKWARLRHTEWPIGNLLKAVMGTEAA